MWDMPFGKQFSDHYRWSTSPDNPHWCAIRKITFALSLGRDCIVPWLRAEQADHLTYRRLGREIPWVDLVPLSVGTHAVVTELRRAGLKWLVNPVLRLAYGLWISPWFIVPWFLLHALHIVPIGPIEAFTDVQNAWNHLTEALSIVTHPFETIRR
jgi:hypothetical protein